MIKFTFNLILIVGIFFVNPAYSEELDLLCSEKEKKIGGQVQTVIGETFSMTIDLDGKTMRFPPSDKTQNIQVIEPNKIRWYTHYQNEKNMTFIGWDLLDQTNEEWVSQGIYITNDKYTEIEKTLTEEKDELNKWLIISTNGLLLSEDPIDFRSIKITSQCKNKN